MATNKTSARSVSKKRKRSSSLLGKPGKVPGPSTNPETNLVLADIALRGVSTLIRRRLEQRLLGGYGKREAKTILQNRGMGKSLASAALSRVATRSLPGAVMIGLGLLAKTLLDRAMNRDEMDEQGDAADNS